MRKFSISFIARLAFFAMNPIQKQHFIDTRLDWASTARIRREYDIRLSILKQSL